MREVREKRKDCRQQGDHESFWEDIQLQVGSQRGASAERREESLLGRGSSEKSFFCLVVVVFFKEC